MSDRWLKLVAGGLLLAAAACGATASGEGDTATAVSLAPGDVALATTEQIAQSVVVTGTLVPYRTVVVRSQVPGVVTWLKVDRGSPVTAGEVMAVIQADGIRSQAAGAKAAVAAAQAGLAVAAKQLASSTRLHAAGAMSDIDYQQAQAGYEAAQAQVAAAQAGQAAADEAARHTLVTSPLTGAVSDRIINEGEAVASGKDLLTVVDTRYLEYEGMVPVEAVASVHAGLPVEFALDAYPGRVFHGTVSRVEPTADAATRQVGVYVRLPNPRHELVGGIYASGRILTGGNREGVVVPIGALRGVGQDSYVWLVKDGRAVKQAVAPGTRDDGAGWVEIASGVAAGDTVVAAPGELTDGAAVRVAPPAGVGTMEKAAPPRAEGR